MYLFFTNPCWLLLIFTSSSGFLQLIYFSISLHTEWCVNPWIFPFLFSSNLDSHLSPLLLQKLYNQFPQYSFDYFFSWPTDINPSNLAKYSSISSDFCHSSYTHLSEPASILLSIWSQLTFLVRRQKREQMLWSAQHHLLRHSFLLSSRLTSFDLPLRSNIACFLVSFCVLLAVPFFFFLFFTRCSSSWTHA